jgi:hypothetical protein
LVLALDARFQVWPDLLRGGHNAYRDGQVVRRAFPTQVGRSEVERDAVVGEVPARVLDRRAHSLFRLLHRSVGQTDDDKHGHTPRGVHLNLDGGAVQPDHSETGNLGQHGRLLSSD